MRGGIKLKIIPFHWIKIPSSNYYFTFSSLLWNIEYVASILKLHWQGINTFYTSSAVTYHYCDTIYTLISHWFNGKINYLTFCYLDVIQLRDACRQNPEWTIQSPNLTSRDHCISPSHCFLGYSLSTLKPWSPFLSSRCKSKCFFLFFSNKCRKIFIWQDYRKHILSGVECLFWGFFVN